MKKLTTIFILPLALIIFFDALLTTSIPAGALGGISVSTTSDEFGAGPGCSLREAIQSANTDSNFGGCLRTGTAPYTITLPEGTYTLTGPGGNDDNSYGDLDIHTSMTIDGGDSYTTIIQAGLTTDTGVDRVIHIEASGIDVTLTNVTIRHGRLTIGGEGGGIYWNSDGTFNLYNCLIKDNLQESTGLGGGGLATIGGTVNLDYSTITKNLTGGASNGFGGGIYNEGSNLNLIHHTYIGETPGNTALFGGGIYNTAGGTILIDDSKIIGNIALFDGGGIYNTGPGSTVSITNHSTIIENTAGAGGGIFNTFEGGIQMYSSTLSDNIANGSGGGIFIAGEGSTLTAMQSTFSGNSATDTGGGIYAEGGIVGELSNSTISGNQSDNHGGGVASFTSTITMTNMTIANNLADRDENGTGDGGGVYVEDGSNAPNYIANSIVAENVDGATENAPECAGTLTTLGNNLIGNNIGCSGFTHGENGDFVGSPGSPLDPRIGALTDNGGGTLTHALLPGSLAINNGNTMICLAIPVSGIDQRGYPRPGVLGGSCDIGAYESAIMIAFPIIRKR